MIINKRGGGGDKEYKLYKINYQGEAETLAKVYQAKALQAEI